MIHDCHRIPSIQYILKAYCRITVLGKLKDLFGQIKAQLLALVEASILLSRIILLLIRLGTVRRRTISVVLSASGGLSVSMSVLFFSATAGSGAVIPHGWLLVGKQSLVVWRYDLQELLLVVLLEEFLLFESDWNKLLLVLLQLVHELILYLWYLVLVLISWWDVIFDDLVQFLEVKVVGGLFSVGGAVTLTINFLSILHLRLM